MVDEDDIRKVSIYKLNAELFHSHRQECCDIFSSISFTVDSLKFFECELTQIDYLTIITEFKTLTNLGYFNDEVCCFDIAMSLEYLKHFHLEFSTPAPSNGSRTRIIELLCHILANSEMLETVIFHETLIPNADETDPLAKLREIIFRQRNLIHLDIQDSKFFNKYSVDPKFKLETFKMMSDKFRFNHEQTKNLTTFLILQKDVCVLDCQIATTLQIPSLRKVDDNFDNIFDGETQVFKYFDSMKSNPYVQIYTVNFGDFEDLYTGKKNDGICRLEISKYQLAEIKLSTNKCTIFC